MKGAKLRCTWDERVTHKSYIQNLMERLKLRLGDEIDRDTRKVGFEGVKWLKMSQDGSSGKLLT
jgi:hypothetical protein